MKELIYKLKFIAKDTVLRKRILFILAMFLVFRLFSAVPIPDVDMLALRLFFEDNNFLGMINMFSGGGIIALSIVMLGVMPYITAAIIMQLATIMFPKIKEIQQEEGEAGRKKIANISRLLSIPLAAIQAFGFLHLLQFQKIVPELTSGEMAFNVLIIVSGSIFVMWLGELISEFGIGNGISLIIFAGIVSSLPGILRTLYETLTIDMTLIPTYLGVFVVFLIMVYAIVFITEAERPVPIQHARASRGGQKVQSLTSFIPIKLNQAGVIPIIFAISIISFPQMISGFLSSVGNSSAAVEAFFNFMQNPLYSGIIYFGLVFFFTFFYTAVTFDPKRMSENLQKQGAFVPGIRPGVDTEEYLGKITTRVTFLGALFLSTIAIMPNILQAVTGIQALSIGGASLLILVSVGIDLIRKINAQIAVREYISSV